MIYMRKSTMLLSSVKFKEIFMHAPAYTVAFFVRMYYIHICNQTLCLDAGVHKLFK